MTEIKQEMLSRFNVGDIDFYISMTGDDKQGEYEFYKTFLSQTDYIITKLAEYIFLGKKSNEDYSEVIIARQFAREQISNLTK